MLNSNTGWACGSNGKIVSTFNGGTNWISQTTPTVSLIRQIHFVDSNTGFAVTDNGSILKTTNAGDPIGINPVSTEIPNEYLLLQNYPNPFNPVTQIEYSLIHASEVTLSIYNISGEYISTLVNEHQSAGTYRTEFDGSNLASGVYIYKLSTPEFTGVKKMILIK